LKSSISMPGSSSGGYSIEHAATDPGVAPDVRAVASRSNNLQYQREII